MNLKTPIFRYPFKLYTHKRRVRPVSVSEVDLVEGLPFQAGRPVWLELPIFDFFYTRCDLVEPVAVKR